MEATLYHNPRCSKSRQALALLEEKGVSISVREYIKEPLNPKEIKSLLAQLQISAHDLLRTKEADYKVAKLSAASSDSDIIDAMIQYPKLLERPIVSTEKGSRIGRPTEAILEIL